ncbi:cation:proton antiporter [filamentous cyanobacterium LEGE 11480]|uniref:Cation:proton antiporter n=1 Tax=Romeriopsis navalis LEGE 11480 TaxID=2777977 RepID=A0A928Z3Y4_9CYAN|nr:cation:proton antiporter [Romeriopsis navalis]MBE9030482.1 cation:proton antiporter [Romeriopsis navalis LEGE 11480]
MLESILWIVLMGFFVGQIARRLKAPALAGMILVGLMLGPQVSQVIAPSVLESADDLRTIAVMVILMKAGLGLDRDKLDQQGNVALRLGFLPATFEAITVALVSMWLFQFNFATGLLLGCIIGAESPAVIVPGMLRLKSLGWGVKKGIPDAILTGSALSDVLLLLVFSLLLTFLAQGTMQGVTIGALTFTRLQLLPFQIIIQIGLGMLVGWLTAKGLVAVLRKQNWTQNTVQDSLVSAGIALLVVVLAKHLPIFSGYLAVMAAGFFVTTLDAPLSRRLRQGFDSLWTIAQIFLFVLLGANIQLDVLENQFLPGLLLLAIGTLGGRMCGWYLATLGSNWNWKEKLFLLPGNSAKATVQAAIGAIPLAQGIAGGETILAIAVLSILVTAPLGAWAIPTFAPRLLEQGEVDPTKVVVERQIKILAAIDDSPLSKKVLAKAAELARRGDAEVIVLHVDRAENPQIIGQLQIQAQTVLADIRHKFITDTGAVAEAILATAQQSEIDELVIGKRGGFGQFLVGSVSQAVLEASTIPVVIVE